MTNRPPGSGLGAAALVSACMLGIAGCGGGGASAPSGPAPLQVFVTSVSGSGDLSSWADAGGRRGLAAADAVCGARARAAGLGGTYVAWLSDDSDDAYCRVQGLTGKRAARCGQASVPSSGGPWVRTDGFPFSGTLAELVDDNVIYSPLRRDEFGAEVLDGLLYTATNEQGALNALFGTTCTNWTAASADQAGGGGTEHLARFWTDVYGLNCNLSARLICMGTGSGGPLPAFASSGKRVFATSVGGTGDLSTWADAGGRTGLAAADAVCRARAAAAGLAGNFKAWLSDSSVDAIDRLNGNGPWVRMDGVRIATDKADLTDGRLFSAIAMDETGLYPRESAPWTGTDASGRAKPDLMCDDWRSASPTDTGVWGQTPIASGDWTDNFEASCNRSFRLFCFED